MIPSFDGGMAVVVAHPDDEALWLSSVLGAADRVVFCFGDPFNKPAKAEARRQAVAALPLRGLVDLALPESGAGFCVDWQQPRLTASGIAIREDAPRARYEANYTALIAALRPALAGIAHVCTHNPWGEYGHAEHIQVHRAVRALQAELGFVLWFTNYVGRNSRVLARQIAPQPCRDTQYTVRPDRALAQRLRDVYRRHGAWTWSRWHRWPATETLYGATPDGTGRTLTGETLLNVAGLDWAPWRNPHWRPEQSL